MEQVVEDDRRDERRDESDQKRRAIDREQEPHACREQSEHREHRLPRRDAPRWQRTVRALAPIGRKIEQVVEHEPDEVERAEPGREVHDHEQIPELERVRRRRA